MRFGRLLRVTRRIAMGVGGVVGGTAWLALFESGCASLPRIAPVASVAERQAIEAECLAVFPAPPWSASHAMDASLPLGHSAVLIGVTKLSDEAIQSLLLSPEGLVLFDATLQRGAISVHRAVSPLDHPGFAEGLMADVRTAFLRPGPGASVVGHAGSGRPVCRGFGADGEARDVEVVSSDAATIRHYRHQSLVRQVDLLGARTDGFTPDLVIRVPGPMGYTLRLHLLDHERPAELGPRSPAPP